MGGEGNTRTPGEIPSPAEVADRLACADLLDAYITAIDACDWDLLASLLTDDARLDYTSSGGPAGGHADVVGWLEAGLSGFTVVQHMLCNLRIRIDGHEASARPYLINPMTLGSDNFLLAGRYSIRFLRNGNRWRIDELVQETTWAQGLDLKLLQGGT